MPTPSLLPQKDENLFEYWLSFSPLAPWFGVKWRLAPGLKSEKDVDRAIKKAVKNAAQVTREASEIAGAQAAKSMKRAGESAAAMVGAAKDTTRLAAEAAAENAAGAQEAFAKAAADAAEIMTEPAKLFAARPASVDDLTAIKGVGPKLERELNELGVYTYEQIASLTRANLAWLDAHMNTIKGRSLRDRWVEQAKALMK